MKSFDSLRLSLLDVVYRCRSVPRLSLMREVGGVPLDVDAVIRNLIAEGYLFFDGSAYSLTSAGREYRLVLEEKLNELDENSSKEERRYKEDRTFRILDLVISIVSIVGGMLLEYGTGFVSSLLK